MYTQCPKCRTVFAVSEEQLQTRAGMVRCGQCHTVFQADASLFEELPEPAVHQHEPRSRQEPSFEQQPGPEVSDRPPTRHTRQRAVWPWVILDLTLALVLFGQWVYGNRDLLAAQPGLSPWITQVCIHLPCRLHRLQDAAAIELRHARVTAHPKFRGALEVRFTLVNRASFAQPYPRIELTLLAVDGKAVARRTFSPTDYHRDGALMAPNVAEPIQFGVTRPPAIAALSYELRVYPATPIPLNTRPPRW